jgi:hypothetical protein
VIHRSIVFAACCLLAVAVAAQVDTAPLQTEQVETGFANLPGHPQVAYQIRLLPVSSFPQLPQPVAEQLDERGCMIPQTYEAHSPENVIQGSFEKKGSSDWAALCSIKGVTTLYVFFQSDFKNPVSLRHQRDSTWLGKDWSLDYGSAWGISSQFARLMQPADHAEHDGIEDAFVEQSSVVHYFNNGHWTIIDPSQ